MAKQYIGDYLASVEAKEEPSIGDRMPMADTSDNNQVKTLPATVNPIGTLYLSGIYTNNVSPYFSDLDLALTRARALISSGQSKVVIKAFLDSDGNPIGLGDEDIYDLADEGIYFESEFDVWEKFIRYGMDIDNSDLLYNLTNENLTLDLTN